MKALDEDLMTLADLRRETGLDDRQVYRLMYEGALGFIRIGRALRFDPAEVRRLVDDCRRRVDDCRRRVPVNADDRVGARSPVTTSAVEVGRNAKSTSPR